MRKICTLCITNVTFDAFLKNLFSINCFIILGSSIATSLCEGESKPKHVGLLKINKNHFKMTSLKLKSVRPFIFDNIILEDHDIKIGDCVSVADSISQYIDRYIENELMPKVAEQLTGIINIKLFFITLNYSLVRYYIVVLVSFIYVNI